MNVARWHAIRSQFESITELPPADRAARLESEPDPEVRRVVTGMLRHHDDRDERLARIASDHPVGEAARALIDDAPAIEGYRILRPLGRGGMGTIHLAERIGEDYRQLVAVKVLRRGMLTAEGVRRFQHERRTLAGLRHDHIAGLLDGGVTLDGRPFLVTEFVDGVSIDRYCQDHSCSIEDRVRLMLPICDAVAHAHRMLVVHRDLKPTNVLVDDAGHPRLLDFGIAKSLEDLDDDSPSASALTITGERPMTPRYASPEQVRGEPVTVATDVHALGVLLYELLTGQSPFGDRAVPPAELERRIQEDDPARPSAVILQTDDVGEGTGTGTRTTLARRSPESRRRAAAVRGDLDVIALTALAKDPARRYPGADALAEDLRRRLAHEPIRARPPSRTYRTKTFLRRHRSSVRAASLTALVLAGVAAAAVVVGVIAPREAEEMRRQAHLTLLGPDTFDAIQSAVIWNCEPAVDTWTRLNSLEGNRYAATLERAASYLASAARFAPLDGTIQAERRMIERIIDLRVSGTIARPSEDPASLDDDARRGLVLTILLAGLPADVPRLLQILDAAGEPDPMVQGLLGQFLLAAGHPELAYPRLQAAMVAYPESQLVTLVLVEAAIAVGDLGRATRLLETVMTDEQPREPYRIRRVEALLAAQRWSDGHGTADEVDALFQRAAFIPRDPAAGAGSVSFSRVGTIQFADFLLARGEEELAVRYLARACNARLAVDIPFFDINPAEAYARFIPLFERMAASWTESEVAALIRAARDRRGDPDYDPTVPHDVSRQGHHAARTVALDAMLWAYARGRVSLPRRPPRPVVLPGDTADYGLSTASLNRDTRASRLADRLRISDDDLWRVIWAERHLPDDYAAFTPLIDVIFDAWADGDTTRADTAIAELLDRWNRMLSDQ